MQISYGSAKMLESINVENLFSYRHEIFVQRLGWDLPNARDGLEIDQFDREDTLYVAARKASGSLCGCARLLPTTSPYLLGSIFPELMRGEPIPSSNDIWEISRFCSVDLDRDTHGQVDYWGCKEILAATVKCAIEVGATKLIGVSVLAIEKILIKLGVNAYRAGAPMRIRGHTIFAFWLDIDVQTLFALGLHEMIDYCNK